MIIKILHYQDHFGIEKTWKLIAKNYNLGPLVATNIYLLREKLINRFYN